MQPGEHAESEVARDPFPLPKCWFSDTLRQLPTAPWTHIVNGSAGFVSARICSAAFVCRSCLGSALFKYAYRPSALHYFDFNFNFSKHLQNILLKTRRLFNYTRPSCFELEITEWLQDVSIHPRSLLQELQSPQSISSTLSTPQQRNTHNPNSTLSSLLMRDTHNGARALNIF